MKKLFSVLVGIAAFLLIIFYVDSAIATWFVNLLPQSANDWKPFLHIVCWVVLGLMTAGISVWIGMIVSAITLIILKLFGTMTDKPKIKSVNPLSTDKPLSKWAQRLEEMQKEQAERKKY